MPSFGSIPAPGLYPGDHYALVNNAAVDSGILITQAVAIPQLVAGNAGENVTLQNTTNQTATVQGSAFDYPSLAANYSPLKDADTANAVTVAAGSTINFTCSSPFVNCTFAAAPTTGSLIIAR